MGSQDAHVHAGWEAAQAAEEPPASRRHIEHIYTRCWRCLEIQGSASFDAACQEAVHERDRHSLEVHQMGQWGLEDLLLQEVQEKTLRIFCCGKCKWNDTGKPEPPGGHGMQCCGALELLLSALHAQLPAGHEKWLQDPKLIQDHPGGKEGEEHDNGEHER